MLPTILFYDTLSLPLHGWLPYYLSDISFLKFRNKAGFVVLCLIVWSFCHGTTPTSRRADVLEKQNGVAAEGFFLLVKADIQIGNDANFLT